ncbi:MAG: hypothetical protein S4CHLAM37_01630 [Chlamydiia bacterium]|nr:hypothetical protein [Chlamydiia bacterium]
MKPRVIRKSPFTLVEVLISFSLLAIILGILFTHFRSSSIISSKTEKVKTMSLAREHVYERLSQMFSCVESSEKFFVDESACSFYTEEVSENEKPKELYFGIKHSIDREIEFSSYILGKLFIDEENILTMELRPYKKENAHKVRIEKMLPSVKNMAFTFYKIKKEDAEDGKLTSSLKDFEILDRFVPDEKNLPYALTITLFLENEETPIEYTFFISSQIEPIAYVS